MKAIQIFFIVLISFACNDEVSEIVDEMNQSEPEPEEKMEPVVGGKFLALGDSYTIGESVEEEYRWPNQLQDSLEARAILFNEPQIIATTGWRTDQLMGSAKNNATDTDYGLVSLLIGVNNQFQGRSVEEYEPEFRELLEFAIERAAGRKDRVIVLSIPDYGCTPFGERDAERIGRAIDEFNAANRAITLELGVRYFNITSISREGKDDPSLVASDGLHPSGEQYVRWVQEILKDDDFLQALKY